MTPNDFGIIRQADHNLFAMLFPPLYDISEYEIEVIHPEYIVGEYVGSLNGNPISQSQRMYAIVDLSKYDYALIPVQAGSNSHYVSGLRSSPSSGAFNTTSLTAYPTNNEIATAWGVFAGFTTHSYAVVNVEKDQYLPIIAFRRHRSDHVNPLGVIQPINPGILQPGSLQPQVEDPDAHEEDLDVQDPEEQEES